MLYHCPHALTMYHGSFMANSRIMCMDYEWDKKKDFVKEGCGWRDFHLEARNLSMSIFNKVLHLWLGGHVRRVLITAILIMK